MKALEIFEQSTDYKSDIELKATSIKDKDYRFMSFLERNTNHKKYIKHKFTKEVISIITNVCKVVAESEKQKNSLFGGLFGNRNRM